MYTDAYTQLFTPKITNFVAFNGYNNKCFRFKNKRKHLSNIFPSYIAMFCFVAIGYCCYNLFLWPLNGFNNKYGQLPVGHGLKTKMV